MIIRVKRNKQKREEPPKPIVQYYQNLTTDEPHEHLIAIEFRTTKQSVERVLLPRAHVASPDKVVEVLFNSAADIPLQRKAAMNLVGAVLQGGPQYPDARITDRPGWHEGGQFVTEHRTFAPQGVQPVLHRLGYMQLATKPASGKCSEWSAAVDRLCEQSSYALFGVGVGLAAPLLDFMPDRTGIAFNVTSDSGAGKSTLLVLAQSVRARVLPVDMETLNVTPTFLEETGWAFCDQVLCLDEFGAADGSGANLKRFISNVAFSTRDGKGRSRSKKGRQWTGQSGLKFRNAILTSSETPLTALAGGVRIQGEQNRFIDVFVPERAERGIFDLAGVEFDEDDTRFNFLTGIHEVFKRHYGKAQIVLVSKLVRQQEKWAGKAARYATEFHTFLTSEGFGHFQIRYRAAFATVYAALRVASDMGILSAKRTAIRHAVWNAFRRSELVLQSTRPLQDIFDRLITHVADEKECPFLAKGEAVSNSDIWMVKRTSKGRDLILIDPLGLERFLGSADANRIETYLAQQGISVKDAAGNARPQTQGTGLGTVRRPRLIVLDKAALDRATTA